MLFRSDHSLSVLRSGHDLPVPPAQGLATPVGVYVSIPDARLAASNANLQAILEGKKTPR